MKNYKVAVIGCGYWGKNLVRKFSELGSLAAICDTDKTQARNIAKLYGNVPIMDMEEISMNTTIDGVAIASPAIFHAEHVKKFLKAGKHVFVEKPLALNLNDAIALQELADQQKLILMVGHIVQYHPAYIQLKNFIKNGTLGNLKYIYSNRLNIGKIRTEENVFWSFAPHDISMVLGLTNDPIAEVKTEGLNFFNNNISDLATINFKFKTGLKAHIFVSWINPFKEQKLVVIGDKSMAVFDDSLDWLDKLRLYSHDITFKNGVPLVQKAEATPIRLNPEEPLKKECEHFLECIEKRITPQTDAAEAIRVLQVLTMVQESLNI